MLQRAVFITAYLTNSSEYAFSLWDKKRLEFMLVENSWDSDYQDKVMVKYPKSVDWD